jgi:quercetin dioxygenase-like cupin family protein
MRIITADQAPIFNLPGIEITGFAAPSRGSVENAAWRLRMEPRTPPTVHRVTREEIFIALAGRAVLHIDGAEHPLAAGGAVIVPANVDFALSNPSAAPFEASPCFRWGRRRSSAAIRRSLPNVPREGSGYSTSSGSLPIGLPPGDRRIFSTRASASLRSWPQRFFSASPRS